MSAASPAKNIDAVEQGLRKLWPRVSPWLRYHDQDPRGGPSIQRLHRWLDQLTEAAIQLLREYRTVQAELQSIKTQQQSSTHSDPFYKVQGPFSNAISQLPPFASNPSLSGSGSPLAFEHGSMGITDPGLYLSREASLSNSSFSPAPQSPSSFSPPYLHSISGNSTNGLPHPHFSVGFESLGVHQQAAFNLSQTMPSTERSTLYMHPQSSISDSSVFSGASPYQFSSISQTLYDNDLATLSMSSVNSSSSHQPLSNLQQFNESLASLLELMDDPKPVARSAPSTSYKPPVTVVLEEVPPPEPDAEMEVEVDESPAPTTEEATYDRFPGQRTEANVALLDHSFVTDPIRRTLLSRIRASSWFKAHLPEPTFSSSQDDVTHGLDASMLGLRKKESVFRAFLDGNGACLFPSTDLKKGGRCGKKEKRPLRALAHIRSHLGHRPFVCDGCYKCDERNEKARFFSNDLLLEHKRAENSRKECPFCHKNYGRSAFDRHLASKHSGSRNAS